MDRRYIVIHHSATSVDASVDEITQAHLQRGFDAIGYHYLVDAVGGIHPGRPDTVQGAHAFGLNDQSVGICCIGNFEEHDCPPSQFAGLVKITSHVARRYRVPTEKIIGHADVALMVPKATKTQCPGTNLIRLIGALRERVQLLVAESAEALYVLLAPTEDEGILLKGELTERHLSPTTHTVLPSSGTDLTITKVRVAISRDEASPLWVGNSTLVRSAIYPSLTEFSIYCPQFALGAGYYSVMIEGLTSSGDRADLDGVPLFFYEMTFPLKSRSTYALTPLRAHISLEYIECPVPFLVKMVGTVTNTGTLDWRNIDDEHPFRLGGMLVTKERSAQPILEMRYDFPCAVIPSGDEVRFQFTLDSGDLPQGEYFFHVDVVRERSFWFTERGSSGRSLPLSIVSNRPPARTGMQHLLDPHPVPALDGKESLLYIAPTLPLFDKSTGGRRLMDFFRLLRSQGVQVTFLYQSLGVFSSLDRYLSALDDLGVQHAQDPLDYLSQTDRSHDYSLCVIGWHSFASTILPTVRVLLPNVRIAIDSVDVHWARDRQAQLAGLSQTPSEEALKEKAKECQAYASADEVWVVSESERRLISVEMPEIKARVVGIPSEKSNHFAETLVGRRVLFVGGFNHPPNESAALWAAEIVSQYNSENSEPISLDIVGADPPASIREVHDGVHINVVGFAPSLDTYHAGAKVFLAPMRYGGGVKGKISDAICRGIPVITNQVGSEGLGLEDGVDVLLAETTEKFVAALKSVFAGEVDLEAIRYRAVDTVVKQFGPKALSTVLLPAIRAPSVVIAIVSYNQRELLRLCLESIFEKTQYSRFKVAVVSNACTDGTVEMLREFASRYPTQFEFLESEQNNFFVRPCNVLIRRYPGSDIVLMNNDVEVVNRGWLTNLVDAAYSAANVCGSGGCILDPSGNISEAGAEIYASGFGQNLCRGLPAGTGSARGIRSVGFVSGCLMYMRRDAITELGALDEDFHPMYFEDAAWHYAAHVRGWQTIYTPWAIAVHKEGSSAGQDVSKGMKRYQEVNRKKFLAKFSGVDVERFN
jgi:GT2 family glycosyltransferase